MRALFQLGCDSPEDRFFEAEKAMEEKDSETALKILNELQKDYAPALNLLTDSYLYGISTAQGFNRVWIKMWIVRSSINE